ncbi:unnamed protein product [Vicia faba]|uniref:Acyl carrier protein n=1 Tax=Vicia faba TaxID=3906 RepID=A0AAV1B365_VICFA|nr:unnamed protein product [Vicia faba]
MQSMKKSILSHVNLRRSTERWFLAKDINVLMHLRGWCSSTGASSDPILGQVIRLVKKYDRIDAEKVTETADFQKDLSLDSLDRAELIMALEEEFSLEIPDEKADKLTCCKDVAKYIASEADQKL